MSYALFAFYIGSCFSCAYCALYLRLYCYIYVLRGGHTEKNKSPLQPPVTSVLGIKDKGIEKKEPATRESG